jgi:hypothetical protein
MIKISSIKRKKNKKKCFLKYKKIIILPPKKFGKIYNYADISI